MRTKREFCSQCRPSVQLEYALATIGGNGFALIPGCLANRPGAALMIGAQIGQSAISSSLRDAGSPPVTHPAGPCLPRIVWAGGEYSAALSMPQGGISGGRAAPDAGTLSWPTVITATPWVSQHFKCFCTSRNGLGPGSDNGATGVWGPLHQVGRRCPKLFSAP